MDRTMIRILTFPVHVGNPRDMIPLTFRSHDT